MTTQDVSRSRALGSQLHLLIWLVPAAAFALALASRAGHGNNWDVALLLTWAEKFLAGVRPDVGFIEVNPPGAYLIYTPAAWLARCVGVTTEAMLEVLVFAGIGVSLALSAAILSPTRLIGRIAGPCLLGAAILLLGALPAASFAQREHLGTIALLPFLAVAVARASGASPALWLRMIAGLGAGCAMMAKPHFALVLLPVLVYGVVQSRTPRRVFAAEWLSAGLVLIIYLASICLFFPDFLFKTMPLVVDVYVSVREPMSSLLMQPLALIWLTLFGCLFLVARRDILAPVNLVPLLAALGGVAGFLIQGKGWPNHAYFPVALLALPLARILLGEATGELGPPLRSTVRLTALAGVAIVAVTSLILSRGGFDERPRLDIAGLARLIERVHPQPKLLALSGTTAVGFPVVRMVGGEWVQRYGALWVSDGVRAELKNGALDPAVRDRLEAHAEIDKQSLVEDIQRGKPDVILAQVATFDWLAWAEADPRLAQELANYEPVERFQLLLVLRRKPEALPASDRG